MNGFVTIVGRIANFTCWNILWKITINKHFLKISVYFEMVTQIANLKEKYRKRCLLKNYVLRYNDILFKIFTNLCKCFYLLFVCPYFNGCFFARNHHCSFIMQVFVVIVMLHCCFWTVKHHHWRFTLDFSLDIWLLSIENYLT